MLKTEKTIYCIYDMQKNDMYDDLTNYVKSNITKISPSFFNYELSSYRQKIYHDVILSWEIIGWCNAEDLEIMSCKNEIAVMFESKDGIKVWFHTHDNY